METMNVNLNQQGMLAKLLAREDLTIQHGNYPTAFFDPKSRVLGLPIWKDTSKALYDLLVGHEVGHALYTPVEGIAQFTRECPTLPFDICNIVEDIRIERFVQETYPGLSASFRSGYRSLADANFFGIKDKDISKLSFADRLNIHAKCGQNISVPLSGDELKIYDRCLAAKDFNDVIQICKDIAHLVGKKSDEMPPPGQKAGAKDDSEEQSGDKDGFTDEKAKDDSEEQSGTKDDSEEKAKDQAKDDSEEQSGAKDDSEEKAQAKNASNVTCTEDTAKSVTQELTSLTADALKTALKSLVDMTPGTEYFIPPSKARVLKLIVPYKKLLAGRMLRKGYSEAINSPDVVASIAKSKAAGKKYVAGLTREFEMRKCAHQHSRATIAKTGTLNMSRLHGYRYSEDIFKSVTNLADAKNHGMVMFVDYSASMGSTLGHVLEHTVNLVMFCKSVGIPFQVYGFTNPTNLNTPEAGVFPVTEINLTCLALLELFSSKMNKLDFSMAITQTLAQAYAYSTRRVSISHFNAPEESLNGTPLNECVVAAHTIVSEFRKTNRVEKMNVVFLSDGDGTAISRHAGQDQTEHKSWNDKRQLRGILNGQPITINSSTNEFSILIRHLRKTTNSNVLGFFIPTSTGRAIAKAYMSAQNHVSEANLRARYKADGCLAIKDGFGYTEFYVLSIPAGLAITDDEEFGADVDVDAGNVKKSTGKLARAFIEFNDNKHTNRIILSKFAQAIA